MPSRMDRYYNNNQNTQNSRARRNSSLYEDIYDGVEYSNVEGIATIEKKNEIDLDKIRELLKEHDEAQVNNRPVIRRQIERVSYEEPEEEKNYDIMDVLNKAKDDIIEDNKSRSLKNTQYNILKNINIKEQAETNEESLKELINTITNASVLNKLEDKDLSLNLLEDLKSTDNTMIGARGSNEIFKYEEQKDNKEEENIDKSFFTSSLNFGEKDFEQLNDIKHSLKKNNILISILVFIFLVLIITGVLFILYNLK